ncbi:MAG: serine/threonine-protein kinase [Candidatus Zixiibacteriota bacterium]
MRFPFFRKSQKADTEDSVVKPDYCPKTQFSVGDTIGAKYLVKGILGGEKLTGFGEVYVCLNIYTGETVALKTFQSRFLSDRRARDSFQKEVALWINIPPHPHIVKANWAQEISGRLFLQMEFIGPDEDGRNCLSHYLDGRILPFDVCLTWAIEICCGMEYAHKFGVEVHRDLKPDNILITTDKHAKITDFGLAILLSLAQEDGRSRKTSESLLHGTGSGMGLGTPIWMPPEQFRDARNANVRNDVYSFGIVLYQMRTGGQPPFLSSASEPVKFWREMYVLHAQHQPPPLKSRIWPIIARCLEKNPSDRYSSFTDIRLDLQRIFATMAGRDFQMENIARNEAEELNNRGASLSTLGKHSEALEYLARALEIAPSNASVWVNKGVALHALGRVLESVECFDKALSLVPNDATALNNKGICMVELDDRASAQTCFEEAVKLEPGYVAAWINGGRNLTERGYHDLAIHYFEAALRVDPKSAYAWSMKADCLRAKGLLNESLTCLNRVLEINPFHYWALFDKAETLEKLGRRKGALRAWGEFVERAENEPSQRERVEFAKAKLYC